jgi:hypothetical protein
MDCFRLVLFATFFVCVFAGTNNGVLAQSGSPYVVDIVAYVPGCGDGVIQGGEQCDGTNFGGTSCSSLGLGNGVVQCSSVCTVITNACVPTVPQTGGGTRIERDPIVPVITKTNVIVSGQAAPGAVVSVMRDAQPYGMAMAKADGTFQITIAGFIAGTYLLQVRAELGTIHHVMTDTFVVQVNKDSTTKVSDVLVPPIVRGGTVMAGGLELRGMAVPNTVVNVLRQGSLIGTGQVSSVGEFIITTDTPVARGERLELVMIVTNRPPVRTFFTSTFIGESDTAIEKPLSCLNSVDISGECRVDLKDFAIAVYTYLFKPVSARIDFNKDGQIDLVDFSIMAFYWTG